MLITEETSYTYKLYVWLFSRAIRRIYKGHLLWHTTERDRKKCLAWIEVIVRLCRVSIKRSSTKYSSRKKFYSHSPSNGVVVFWFPCLMSIHGFFSTKFIYAARRQGDLRPPALLWRENTRDIYLWTSVSWVCVIKKTLSIVVDVYCIILCAAI